MIDKINEIVDWINARESNMKESIDMLESSLKDLKKERNWKVLKVIKKDRMKPTKGGD